MTTTLRFPGNHALIVLVCMLLWLLTTPVDHALAQRMGGGGMGGGGGGRGGDGSTVIDPPVGALFKDPVEMGNLSAEPGVVEIDLSAGISPVMINGTMANLMTFNGSFPGPPTGDSWIDLTPVQRLSCLRARGWICS